MPAGHVYGLKKINVADLLIETKSKIIVYTYGT
jgi:hypothetical protein